MNNRIFLGILLILGPLVVILTTMGIKVSPKAVFELIGTLTLILTPMFAGIYFITTDE